MGDRHDDRDEGASSDGDRSAGRLQPLVDLLDGLLTIAESDRIADGRERATTEVDVSVSSVDEFLDHQRAEAQAGRSWGETTSSERSKSTTEGEYHVGTQFDGQEFVVVADLLGTSIEEVAAGLTRAGDALVIQCTGETVARVDLPWESATVSRAWFNNGVLEIRLRSEAA